MAGIGLSVQRSEDALLPESENRIRRTMTRTENELLLNLLAYVLAAGCSLLIAYLGWRKIRSHPRPCQYQAQPDE